MPRKKGNKTVGRKRQNPSTSKPKAKKRRLNNDNDEDIDMNDNEIGVLLHEKQICITGSFKLQQKEMIKLITDNGGKRNATCSKKCDYLIMNNLTSIYSTNSNKCKKAKENGVPIIREQWLYDSIKENELLDIDGTDENGKKYVIYWREKRKLAKYPKKIDINNHHKNIDNINIFKKLILNRNTRDFGMIIYFKALNRYPGGNADMYLIKYILLVNGNNISLKKLTRSNWDGMNYISKKPFQLKIDNELNYINRITQCLMDLYCIEKKQDIYTQVVDKKYDSEHYDTEWTHLDFKIYVAPKYKDNNNNTNNDRRYKSDECEIWKCIDNAIQKEDYIIDVVDDYIGDYDIEKDWLQIISFQRNAIYCSGYGENRKIPKPDVCVSKEGEKLINCVSELCGLIRPINETPYDDTIKESRSSKDNKTFDKDVELDMGKTDCYDMPSILIKGYDY